MHIAKGSQRATYSKPKQIQEPKAALYAAQTAPLYIVL